MNEVAPVSSRSKKARCPTCKLSLAEPGSPIYECPFCFTLLLAKGVPPDCLAEWLTRPTTDNGQGPQGSQQSHGLKAISSSGNVSTRQQSQEQVIDPWETDAHGHGNLKLPEQPSVPVENGSVKNISRYELQGEVDACRDGSASTGNTDMLADRASNTSTATADEGMAFGVRRLLNGGGKEDASANSGGEESQEESLLSDHMNELWVLSNGDDKPTSQMRSDNAENQCEPNGREEESKLVGDSESMQGKEHGECHPEEGERPMHSSQSDIVRDNDYDLSLPSRKRNSRPSKLSSEPLGRVNIMSNHLTDELPYSSDANSEDTERYLSTLESINAHDSAHSKFDFPSPSADSMKPVNASDLYFQMQNVLSDVPAAPHQLEWEDDGLENEEISQQKSVSATVASIGAVNGSVPGVLTGIDQGDQVESADGNWQHQKSSSPNGILSVGLQDWKGERCEETKGDSDGYIGNLSYRVNAHKSVLSTDLRDEIPHSLLAGAEQPSKLKAGSSLKRASTSSTLVFNTEAPELWSTSDGRDVKSHQASLETIKLTNSVANIQPSGDSITTIARKTTDIIGGSHHFENASQMILTENISKRAPDPLHYQQSGFLQYTDNQGRAASTIHFATGWDAEKVSLHNKEAEYVGMPSVYDHGSSSNCSVNGRLQLKRNYAAETRRGHNGEGTSVNMFDSRLHHKRNYSSEETQMQSERFTSYTSQVPPKNVRYEGLHVSRSTRESDGSINTHYTHGQAALMPAYRRGSRPQKLSIMEHRGNYSCPLLTDACGFAPASLQPFGNTYFCNGSDSFASGVPVQYQRVPFHSCSLPVAMPGQALVRCGCHSVAPVCMTCIHGHSDFSQHSMPPCGCCCNHALSMAQQHGVWNRHQAHQAHLSYQGASVDHYQSPCLPSKIVPMHDTVMAMEKQLVRSRKNGNLYPPIPRGSATPYVICKGCEEILKIPTDMLLSESTTQKLRCGSCRKVAKFSALKGNSGADNNVALQSRTTVPSTKTSHLDQHPEHSMRLPVSNIAQTMEPSYHEDLYPGILPAYNQGSFDSQRQISAAIKAKSRPSSLDEILLPTECEGATTHHSSQDEFFFRSLSRQYCEFDSSRMFFNGFKAASSTVGPSNYCGELSPVGTGISSQAPVVDEKDEGLDFGAPRMSDGESLDQRSPDSMMRSPENMQHFESSDQNGNTENSCRDEEEASRKAESVMLELKKRSIAQGKRPSQSLLTLLNQESSKFEINMEEEISFDESRPALWSTASSSPVDDHLTNQSSGAGDKSRPQPSKLTSMGFLWKGQRYAAGMLRRRGKHSTKRVTSQD